MIAMTSNMKPKPSEKPGATASVAELVELFAVNRRTISSLASKDILARTGHGRCSTSSTGAFPPTLALAPQPRSRRSAAFSTSR